MYGSAILYTGNREKRMLFTGKTVKTALFPVQYPAKVESLTGGASSTSRNN